MSLAVSTEHATGSGHYIQVTVRNLTTSTITVEGYSGHPTFVVRYVAVGYQTQWGKTTSADYYNNAIYNNLVLAFTNENYYIQVQPLGTNDHIAWYSHAAIETRTKTNFLLRSYGNITSTYIWHAVGYQQWGKLTSATTTITFPLAYTSAVYSMSQMQSSASSSRVSRIAFDGFPSTTSCKLEIAEASMFPATWISLGK